MTRAEDPYSMEYDMNPRDGGELKHPKFEVLEVIRPTNTDKTIDRIAERFDDPRKAEAFRNTMNILKNRKNT